MAHRGDVRVDATVGTHPALPGLSTLVCHRLVGELGAVETILVDVDGDGVAVLDERDRTAEQGLRGDMPDDETDGATREPSIGHEGDGNALLATQRRDL